jgi:hypothetical protein
VHGTYGAGAWKEASIADHMQVSKMTPISGTLLFHQSLHD